jgi:hypothetical protein
MGAAVAVLAIGLAVLIAGVGTARAATLPTLSLTVSSSGIAVSGATQSGAVNVAAIASGKLKEPNVVLVALKPGATGEEALAAVKAHHEDPNYANKFGSLVWDEEATAGKGTEAQTVLNPGKYLALFIEGEGGPKAHTEFEVTKSASPAALPAAEATEKTIDFGFTGPSTLHDGELVRFENEGFLVHMDIAVPVRSRAAAKKLIKALIAGKERQAFKLVTGPPAGFAGPISSEAFQQSVVTAKPGVYVQLCFMQTQDGRDHTRLGMERIITITK